MPKRETWIVAVSGGVDSVVLLDVLRRRNDKELVIAHVDHGIRSDSHEDASLVKRLADRHHLPFESTELNLGKASEDLARQRRHQWLRTIRDKYRADAIATAHHQDDVIETILINLGRGTGWRGLCSLRETKLLKRPLLDWSKHDVIGYAINHQLDWREDVTNDDISISRNYLRHGTVARLSAKQRRQWLDIWQRQCRLRQEIERESAGLLECFVDGNKLSRHTLIMADDGVASELVRRWLDQSLEAQLMSRLVHFARVAQAGKKFAVSRDLFVRATKTHIVVWTPEDC